MLRNASDELHAPIGSLVTPESVHYALKHLNDSLTLGESPLARLYAVIVGVTQLSLKDSERTRGLSLRALLTKAIDRLRPYGWQDETPTIKSAMAAGQIAVWQDYLILKERFDKGRTGDEVAHDFHCKRRTITRNTEVAISKLIDAIYVIEAYCRERHQLEEQQPLLEVSATMPRHTDMTRDVGAFDQGSHIEKIWVDGGTPELDNLADTSPSYETRNQQTETASQTSIGSEQYQQDRSLFERHTKEFVGREHIIEAIDDALEKEGFTSGYVVIEGEPRIGKAALSAHLVQKRGYIHHFNIAVQNIRSAETFLTNISAQLIHRYSLSQGLPNPDNMRDSSYLTALLNEVKLKEPGKKVVRLIDALDEVDTSGLTPDVNRLYLPQSLPINVYIIVTIRPKIDSHCDFHDRQDIEIYDKDPRNIGDVHRYAEQFIQSQSAKMNEKLAEFPLSKQKFVSVLSDHSDGNFMYARHVLRDFYFGSLTPSQLGDIRKLPRGLKAYYRRHWNQMRDMETEVFDKYYQPVVCMLAQAREPVTMATPHRI